MQLEHPPNRLLAHDDYTEEIMSFAEPSLQENQWLERHWLDPFVTSFEHDAVTGVSSQSQGAFLQPSLGPLESGSFNLDHKQLLWYPQHQQTRAVSPVRTMSTSDASTASYSPLVPSASIDPQAFSPLSTSATSTANLATSTTNDLQAFSPLVSSASQNPHAFSPFVSAVSNNPDALSTTNNPDALSTTNLPPLSHLYHAHMSPPPPGLSAVDSSSSSHFTPLFDVDSNKLSASPLLPTTSLHPSASPQMPTSSPHTNLTTPSNGLRDTPSSEDAFSHVDEIEDEDDGDSDYRPSKAAGKSRRRVSSGAKPRNKVAKRTPARRPSTFRPPRLSAAARTSSSLWRKSDAELERRHFTCPGRPYGCPTTFATKNEWKRHVISQHLCLGFWRCDLCPDHLQHPNDFNRKDLFTQHLRRMHSPSATAMRLSSQPVASSSSATSRVSQKPRHKHTVHDEYFETQLESIRKRCWVQARQPPARLTCIFCGAGFTADSRCDDFLEHVGRHLAESAVQAKLDIDGCHERHASLFAQDDTFRGWMLDNGLLHRQTPTAPLELVTRVGVDGHTRPNASLHGSKSRQVAGLAAYDSRGGSLDAEGDPDD